MAKKNRKSLKERYRDQQGGRKGPGRTRTASVTASDDDDTHDDEGDDSMEDEEPPPSEEDDVEAEGYEDGDDLGSVEEEEDLDAFDLSALDEMEDEEDDAEAGDVTITHDEDTGDLDIHHDKDDGGDDEEDEGDDAEASADDDDDDMEDDDAEAWVEANLAEPVLAAAISGKNIKTRSACADSLRSEGKEVAAELIESMTAPEFRRFARLMEPMIETGREAMEEIRGEQQRMASLVQAAKAQGNHTEARRIEARFNRSIQAEIAEAEVPFNCPEWLLVKAAPYIEAEAEDTDDDSEEEEEDVAADINDTIDVTGSSDEILAQLAHTLVYDERKSRKAASLVLGNVHEKSVKNVRVVAKLVHQGRLDDAAEMVRESRLAMAITAGYNVDPDVKPTQVDPSQPVTPGAPNRMMGPPPDAGFSYGGMSEEECQEACSTLGCGVEALGWIASAPRDDEGNLDMAGKWACYTEAMGDGDTSEMDLEACKAYLASRANSIHAVYVASLDDLRSASVGEDQIELSLWNDQGDDPFYNVVIGGVPVGRINLTAQANPEQIRGVFVSENYAVGVRQAIAGDPEGPLHALASLNFAPFAAVYNQTQAVHQAREASLQAAESVVQEEAAKQVGNLLDLMTLAHVEFTKNITDKPNPLKWALTEGVRQAGVRNPVEVVENALATEIKAGVDKDGNEVYEDVTAAYFGLLLARAEELGALHPQALEQIAGTILGQPVQLRAASTQLPEGNQTLRERLASASTPVISLPSGMDSGRPDGDQRNANVSDGNLRSALRHGLRANRHRG